MRRRLKILWRILKHTGADKILYTYIACVLIYAALIWIFESSISSFRDALWYCYAVISTAGFGDVVVHSMGARVVSVVLTVHSCLVLAIITGVIVNYYNQIMEVRDKETLSAFFERVERLDELTHDELVELSRKVKEFRDDWS